MQEFYAVAVTKQRLQMTHDEAVVVLQSLAAFPACPITRDLVMEAVELRQRFQISLLGRRDYRSRQADGVRNGLQRRPKRGPELRRRDGRQSVCRRRAVRKPC
jgi:hypothetical protein